jgi:hypothetical protein
MTSSSAGPEQLLSNAVTFTERGFVVLSAEWTAVQRYFVGLRFAVTNSGIGFAQCRISSVTSMTLIRGLTGR